MLIDVFLCQEVVKKSIMRCYQIFSETGINSIDKRTLFVTLCDVFSVKKEFWLAVNFWKR